MQRYIMFLLVFIASFLPAAAQAWWQPDWTYRKPISIDASVEGAKLQEGLGRTPVLVRLHTGNFTFDGVNDNGSDLRFVLDDDKTVLSHQIETFDPLLGIALIWVDLPEIQAGQKRDIWMYYGNAAAPQASNGQTTFDPNYTLIYHFNGAADAPPRDTTAYGNHAQTNVAGGYIDGVVGRSAQFNGTAPLMLPASPSLAVPAGSPFSFSAWVRPDQIVGEQAVYARRDGGNAVLLGLSQGVPFVEINGQRAQAGQALAVGSWQHLAISSDGSQVQLLVQGQPVASLAAAMPALDSATALGGDLPAAPAAADEGAEGSEAVAPAARYAAFVGAMDEIRLSRVARPAGLLYVDALSQGSESRLIAYGVDEQQSGFGFGALGYLLAAVPLDAWIVLAVLAVMLVHSWIIMISKSRRAAALEHGNKVFRERFAQLGTQLEALADAKPEAAVQQRLDESPLWKLYVTAVREVRKRRTETGSSHLSPAAIESIRAAMDSVRTYESQALAARMGALSNAIAGGPYIGLLGTVLGIMVVFLGTAMAGDVNINAIAPGMAAALLATAAGLFVAIPALFGYNRILGRNKAINAEMRVFTEEFATRLAESYGGHEGGERKKGGKDRAAQTADGVLASLSTDASTAQ